MDGRPDRKWPRFRHSTRSSPNWRSGYTAASSHISVKEFRVGVPKRKVSKARQGERRAHLAISAPPLVECEHCHELKRAHHVCPTCGWYAGREAVVIEPVTPVEGQR